MHENVIQDELRPPQAPHHMDQEVFLIRENLSPNGFQWGTEDFDMENWNRFDEYCAEQDEEFIEVNVHLSVSTALASKDAPKWIAAMTKERVKLEANNTWRECTLPGAARSWEIRGARRSAFDAETGRYF